MNEFRKQQEIIDFDGDTDRNPQPAVMIAGKKLYVSPILKHQAHLRDITLAPTTGVHESGTGDGRKAQSSGSDSPPEDSGSGKIFESDIFSK